MEWSTKFATRTLLITTFTTTMYAAFRGLVGVRSDIENMYHNIPHFPSKRSDETTVKTQESIINAASYVHTLGSIAKGVNMHNGISLGYQEFRSGFKASSVLLDGISEFVTGYQVASIASDYLTPYVQAAEDILNDNFSKENVDLAKKVSMIMVGGIISYTTHNPAPLYFAISDSGFFNDNPWIITTAALAVGYSFGSITASQVGIVQGMDYFASTNSAVRFLLPTMQHDAELKMVLASWNGPYGWFKAPLVFTDVARLLTNTVSESATILHPEGNEWLVKRVPNSQELSWTPLSKALILDVFFPDLGGGFVGNPGATNFIRDFVKAFPIIHLWYTNAEIGNTGIHYSLGNVAASFSKPVLKVCLIVFLHKQFGLTSEIAGRIANYLTEPVVMAMNLASKGIQEETYRFSSEEWQLHDGKLKYVVQGFEPIEINTTSLYNKVQLSQNNNASHVDLTYKEAQFVWNEAANNNYPDNSPSIINYILENLTDLTLRGIVVGLLKTVASDQLGEVFKKPLKVLDTSIKQSPILAGGDITLVESVYNKIVLAILCYGKEVLTTVTLATPTRVISEWIDLAVKALTKYYSSPNLIKSDIIEELQFLGELVKTALVGESAEITNDEL